jgi:general stress protein 26
MTVSLGALQDLTFASASRATSSSFPFERRMSEEELATYLDRRAFAVVASTRRDGRPHATMSSYVRRDATFWLPTVSGSLRERNVAHTPAVSLVVGEGDHQEHLVVIVEADAAVVEPAAVPADVRAAVTGDWVTSWIRVDARRVLSYAAEGVSAS